MATLGTPRIAVLRPDHGVLGGFERHLATVVAGLKRRGWIVETIGLDPRGTRSRLLGVPVRPVQYEFHADYFAYLSLVEQTAALDLRRFDAVLTTQPPTYLARHDRKVALFYHQARQFYDLADIYAESGFAEEEIHRAATESVRAIDGEAVGDVRHWLAGSDTVAERLRRYWRIPDDRISRYDAPAACVIAESPPPYDPAGSILHVGRMEWPKRPELLVQAVHLLDSQRMTSFVGGGSRADFVRSLDARLGDRPEDRRGLIETETWRNRGIFTAGWRPYEGRASGRIDFIGPVDDAQRDAAYRSAAVVVAPAHNEDYGLTALEAMAFARPVIACGDGGGLTELVDDGVTGLIVDPDPAAMAAAITRLLEDPTLAARLGLAGHAKARSITEDRAVAQIEQTLEKVLAG
ncbi:MAG: glycosyltransferase family 4 protein [Actinomycetota bacterium]